jgi:hypothetical protein
MPDMTRAERLFVEGRKVDGLTTLVVRLPLCDFCKSEGRDTPALVDGGLKPSMQSWANMCGPHFVERGVDLGLGYGQVLIPTGAGCSIEVPDKSGLIGYSLLISKFNLAVLPPRRLSFLGTTNVRREIFNEAQVRIVYPPSYDPGRTLTAHLEFALKHEGLNLEVLAAFFRRVDLNAFETELLAALREHPLGQHLRRLWFVYEWLTDRVLPIPDLTTGNYVPLVDPKEFYTSPPRRMRRQRINENLLGNRDFSPMVRRTEKLAAFEKKNIKVKVERIVEQYDPDTIRSAVSYLYTKETRSSFGIEGERPSPDRVERFVGLLQRLPKLSTMNRTELIRLQNETVDQRFVNKEYRHDQVYVAMPSRTRQRIEYIAPKPDDVPSLMDGVLGCLARLDASGIDPVVEAAAISFGFVFVHPFSDGNGRLHRLLIHYILSKRKFTPSGLIFPVSAVMQSKRTEYDECLESFSRPLMRLLDYTENEDGIVTVQGDSAPLYRYFDATRMAEDLYCWVEETVDNEFQQELEFIVRFREARDAMSEVVDLPDREANLFVKLCLQQQGRLSKNKREAHFSMLTDAEVRALEEVVRTYLLSSQDGSPQVWRAEEDIPPGRGHSPKHTLGGHKPRRSTPPKSGS